MNQRIEYYIQNLIVPFTFKNLIFIFSISFLFSGCIPIPTPKGFTSTMDKMVNRKLEAFNGFIGKKEYSNTEYIYEFRFPYGLDSNCQYKRRTLKESKNMNLKKNIVVGFITNKDSRKIKRLEAPKTFCGSFLHMARRYEWIGMHSEQDEFYNIYRDKLIPKKLFQSTIVNRENHKVIMESRFNKLNYNNNQYIYTYTNSKGCNFGYITNKNDKNQRIKSWKILNNKEKCLDYE